jgi:signal recognition particle subunit SEC65
MKERKNTKYESLNGMRKKRRGRILPKHCSLNCCLMKKLKSAVKGIVRTGCEVVQKAVGTPKRIYYHITILLTPWSRVLLEKLTSKLCS